jgi:conjugative relaxase-like TrwC/TraI family protein
MLSIGKLGRGQERYYLGKVAEGAEDYYSGEGEAEGYWLGDGAELLGLDGKVDGDQLVAMLTGRNPVDGELLGLKSPPGKEPVPGFDLTFSAPKSVSLTWALGGHPISGQVAEAHRAAVAEALSYLERYALWARRGHGGREFVKGKGLLAAAYRHRSSRAGDPQLHTHVLIANATLGPDGRWSRLYHPAIYEHAKTASYLYEAHLRHELTRRLGVEWGALRKGLADIAGFTPEQLAHFSTRRQEILAAAGEGASARAMQIATLTTRKAKDRDLTDQSLREVWKQKALEVGLDREAIERFLGQERPSAPVLTVGQIERAVTAHASHFDRREAIQAIADNLPHGAPAAEVQALADTFLASEAVIRISETPRGERFTTARIWELEQHALASAEEMADAGDSAVVGEVVLTRVIDARPSLKDDQRAMVERLLAGGEGLAIVVGEAGTGKTYALAAAASGWADSGVELRAAAPTWRAANVLRAEGLGARSVASVLGELDRAEETGRQTLAPGSVLLVDEAGMVDSASLARLIEHARAAEAKLVLIGDPAQLGEIEAGGLFAALVERHDPVVLDQVIRHNHDLDREVAKRIRAGEGSEALALYGENGRVSVVADAEARREAMVAEWWQSFGRGEDSLMIAKRNAEVEKLNAAARDLMRAKGRLGSEEIEVGGACFAPGDQVITRVNDHAAGIYNRERWRIEAVDVEAQSVALAGIDTRGRVCVDAGYLGRVTDYGDPALQHAYAATTYQAQGASVDRAYVAADPSMDRQEFYVATSRSREETFIYATPEVQVDREEIAPPSPFLREGLQHIAEAAERDGAQVSAHDQALRSRLGDLSTAELYRRRDELAAETGAERANKRRGEDLAERIERIEDVLDRFAREAARIAELPRRQRREKMARLEVRERSTAERLGRMKDELRELPASEHQARAEVAVIDHLLERRERSAMAAVQLSPPNYLTGELGERPSDPRKRVAWDKAARQVERYRAQHGLGDRDTALGSRPEGAQRATWDRQRRQLDAAQKALGRQRERSLHQERSHRIDLGIGR